jgi:hypothetical protein
MKRMSVSAAAALCLLAAPLSAQTNPGGFANASVTALNIEDGVSPGVVGSIGYRFNAVVGLGVELTSVFNVTSPPADVPIYPLAYDSVSAIYPDPYPYPSISIERDEGHATILTTNIWLTVPTRGRRVAPYFVAGGGVGAVTDRLSYTYEYPPIRILPAPLSPSAPVTLPTLLAPRTEFITRTTSDFAATLGGGVRFFPSDRWSFDADARYIVVLGSRNARIGRVGGGVTYFF